MEPDLNNSPQDQAPKYPDGFENWPAEDKEKFLKSESPTFPISFIKTLEDAKKQLGAIFKQDLVVYITTIESQKTDSESLESFSDFYTALGNPRREEIISIERIDKLRKLIQAFLERKFISFEETYYLNSIINKYVKDLENFDANFLKYTIDNSIDRFPHTEGFDELPIEKKVEWIMVTNSIRPQTLDTLKGMGINIEVIPDQSEQVLYDRKNKILKIQKDVESRIRLSDFIEESILPNLETMDDDLQPEPAVQETAVEIEDVIFKEQEGIDQLPDPGELEDIHIEDDDGEGEEDEKDEEEITPPDPLLQQEGEAEAISPEPVSVAPESAVEPVSEPQVEPITLENEPKYKIGDKIRFRNITGSRIMEGEIKEIDSEKIKVFDPEEVRFYDIKKDQIEEILSSLPEPTSVTPEQTVPVAVAPEAVISEEDRKNIEANYVPEWQEGEEWEQFTQSRMRRAKLDVKYNKAILFKTKKHNVISPFQDNVEFDNLEQRFADAEYTHDQIKDVIAQKIKETFRKNAGENLTPEQQADLQSKINDKIFEELTKGEAYAYRKAVKEARGDTKLDKALEKTKMLLNTKVAQWYLRQNKWARLAVTTTLFTVGGYALGTAAVGGTLLSATGYGVGRGIRGAASILGGNAARVTAEKYWTEEKVNEKFKEKEKAIKESTGSQEEQSREYEKLLAWEDKEKKRIKRNKTLVTIGVGAGAGILAGLTEGAVSGKGVGSVAESKAGKAPDITENRLPPKKGFQFTPIKPSPPSSLEEPNVEIKPTPVSEIPLPPKNLDSLNVSDAPVPKPIESIVSEKMFDKPEVFIHKVEAGDSTWKMLKDTLENFDRFKKLGGIGTPQEIAEQIEAKQTRVLQSYVGEVLKNHDQYKVGPNGEIEIGKEVDFSKLFADSKKFDEILNDAENLKPTQVSSIIGNNDKIEAWVQANPGKKFDIDEILSDKPKIEIKPTPVSEILLPPKNSEFVPIPTEPPVEEPKMMQGTLEKIKEIEVQEKNHTIPPLTEKWSTLFNELVEKKNALKLRALELQKMDPHAPGVVDEILKVSKEVDQLENQMKNLVEEMKKTPEPLPIPKPINPKDIEDLIKPKTVLQNQLEGEIADAKQRLVQLEGNTRNPNLERTLASDSKSMMSSAGIAQNVETAFRSEIDSIYGKEGFLGLGKVVGVNSKEWGEMARLPASKVVEYCTGDSHKSGLSSEVVDRLVKSKHHRILMEQTAGLMKETDGAVKPFENENMEQFIKRLGGYVLKTHSSNALQNLPKAA